MTSMNDMMHIVAGLQPTDLAAVMRDVYGRGMRVGYDLTAPPPIVMTDWDYGFFVAVNNAIARLQRAKEGK